MPNFSFTKFAAVVPTVMKRLATANAASGADANDIIIF